MAEYTTAWGRKIDTEPSDRVLDRAPSLPPAAQRGEELIEHPCGGGDVRGCEDEGLRWDQVGFGIDVGDVHRIQMFGNPSGRRQRAWGYVFHAVHCSWCVQWIPHFLGITCYGGRFRTVSCPGLCSDRCEYDVDWDSRHYGI